MEIAFYIGTFMGYLCFSPFIFATCLSVHMVVSAIFPSIKKISWRYQVLITVLIFSVAMKIVSIAI